MAPAPEKADSVYDFLYVDLPRIQLFNSQFSQYGHITELTRSTTTSSSSGGGFDVKVVRADTTEGEQTGIAKRYDTQFIAPLSFLDHAQKMIVRDLSKTRIGQFVLASGTLSILDLPMLQNAWELPSVKRLATIGAQQAQSAQTAGQSRQERRARQSVQADEATTNINFMFDLLKIMPHGVQGQLASPPHDIWLAMRSVSFITQPSDLTLNHGIHLSGTWNVVGILDAMPDALASPAGNPSTDHSLVGNLAMVIQPLGRQTLGRPVASYGVTPLLVFREVNG